jgi:hypothetical protein
MTVTTGDEQAASDEPLEMRRGTNYGQPGPNYSQPGQYGQPGYRPPSGPAGYGQPSASKSRVPLVVLVAALALGVAIVVLLLSL